MIHLNKAAVNTMDLNYDSVNVLNQNETIVKQNKTFKNTPMLNHD